MADALPELLLADATAWRSWLGTHHDDPAGVWLILAKKGTTKPTSLTYDEALDEALCHGWIDGQVRRLDERTYRQRFTPRRARSPWSKRNVGIVEQLLDAGRMHPAGLEAVERAKADGRWESAYAGQRTIEVPSDLAAALAAEPRAQAMFKTLSSQNRYAVLYRIHNTKRSDTRARRIEHFVAMLARGETVHPQKRATAEKRTAIERRTTAD
ncbi:MAG TPA: YdeI/OmpD-associated family protein [Solirubrobacteraceae bacterium]